MQRYGQNRAFATKHPLTCCNSSERDGEKEYPARVSIAVAAEGFKSGCGLPEVSHALPTARALISQNFVVETLARLRSGTQKLRNRK